MRRAANGVGVMATQRIIAEKHADGRWRVWYPDAPAAGFESGRLWAALHFLMMLLPDRKVIASTLTLDLPRCSRTHREYLAKIE